MFSLNSLNTQNQILVSFSQLSSRYSSVFRHIKHNSVKYKNVRGKEAASTSYDAIICPDSFEQTLLNFDKNVLSEMKNIDLRALSLPARRVPRLRELASVRKVSHISSDSFDSNKNGWHDVPTITVDFRGRNTRFSFTDNFVGLLARNLSSNSFQYAVQVRGFKTERGIHADLKRNPNLINRLRLSASEQPDKQQHHGPEVAPRLEKLLNEESHLTHQQKDKIKIAFAEGYLAGSHPDNVRGTKASKYLKLVQQLLTIVLFLAIFVSLMASVSGTVFRIQLGNQVEVDPEDISVTFDDVKGADEAKQELKDVVEFLKSPEKFSSLGGKLPKGVLLVGPPGTGKTLLARAVAGEARVPFFHAAGPEFDEILVGQGARRVRDLFKAAKERAPCVIFIDEIDSVGAKRTNSVLHPYANQTINQLLSEMDGFHQNEGVIVLGATNRRDDLDQALLRPGRFDVEVNVPTPDYGGRREILELYLARVRANSDVDCDVLARGTTGFTGADLENMVNQAALKAAIDGAKTVTMKYLEDARDKVLMGPERRSRLPDEEANAITAYHEGGHAIVAYYTKDAHPLHKVTIIPRGPSLGHTAYIPAKERYHVTKQQLLAMMDTMMGGRAAEELIFGPEKITSGASSDLKQATSIACHMVREWGMSEKVGLRTMEPPRNSLSNEQMGPSTNELVDGEIRKILSDSYERAKLILRTHAKEHKALAEALLKAATDGAKTVTMKYLEDARDKVLMGPERRSRLPDEEANAITAYHEGGHAIVAYYTKDAHPLHKVTIIPRGPSLGHTAYIPAKERYHVTKQQLLAMMDTMMGGRAAEELIFGPEKITSGASSDLKQATSIACHMVREWGMSEKVGLRTMEPPRNSLSNEQMGPSTNELVDGEIRKILSDSYERAKLILRTHAKEHKALAEALLKYETLDADDIKAIMNGEKVKVERHTKPAKEPISTGPAAPSGAGLLGTPAPA